MYDQDLTSSLWSDLIWCDQCRWIQWSRGHHIMCCLSCFRGGYKTATHVLPLNYLAYREALKYVQSVLVFTFPRLVDFFAFFSLSNHLSIRFFVVLNKPLRINLVKLHSIDIAIESCWADDTHGHSAWTHHPPWDWTEWKLAVSHIKSSPVQSNPALYSPAKYFLTKEYCILFLIQYASPRFFCKNFCWICWVLQRK